jgi:hypothetical protein
MATGGMIFRRRWTRPVQRLVGHALILMFDY